MHFTSCDGSLYLILMAFLILLHLLVHLRWLWDSSQRGGHCLLTQAILPYPLHLLCDLETQSLLIFLLLIDNNFLEYLAIFSDSSNILLRLNFVTFVIKITTKLLFWVEIVLFSLKSQGLSLLIFKLEVSCLVELNDFSKLRCINQLSR